MAEFDAFFTGTDVRVATKFEGVIARLGSNDGRDEPEGSIDGSVEPEGGAEPGVDSAISEVDASLVFPGDWTSW